MTEPTKEQVKWFWGKCLNTRVEMRKGFWDECGDFIEMQDNPYSPPHKTKSLCYLKEDRDFTYDERATYEEELASGKIKGFPDRAQWWEEVPAIDLNNLFKYADAQLDEVGEHYIILQKNWTDSSIKHATIGFTNISKFPHEFEGEDKSYALALLWAILKIFKEKR